MPCNAKYSPLLSTLLKAWSPRTHCQIVTLARVTGGILYYAGRTIRDLQTRGQLQGELYEAKLQQTREAGKRYRAEAIQE